MGKKLNPNVRITKIKLVGPNNDSHYSTFLEPTPVRRAIQLAFTDLKMLNPGIKLKGWRFSGITSK